MPKSWPSPGSWCCHLSVILAGSRLIGIDDNQRFGCECGCKFVFKRHISKMVNYSQHTKVYLSNIQAAHYDYLCLINLMHKTVWIINSIPFFYENHKISDLEIQLQIWDSYNFVLISCTWDFWDTSILYHNSGTSFILYINTVFDKSDFYKIVSIYQSLLIFGLLAIIFNLFSFETVQNILHRQQTVLVANLLITHT